MVETSHEAAAVPPGDAPVHDRRNHSPHITPTGMTASTVSTLSPTAAPTSPRVSACAARSDPHPGHNAPVSARNGQVG